MVTFRGPIGQGLHCMNLGWGQSLVYNNVIRSQQLREDPWAAGNRTSAGALGMRIYLSHVALCRKGSFSGQCLLPASTRPSPRVGFSSLGCSGLVTNDCLRSRTCVLTSGVQKQGGKVGTKEVFDSDISCFMLEEKLSQSALSSFSLTSHWLDCVR